MASGAAHETEKAALARLHMVDGQIRPNQVNDGRVLAAMRALPREKFLPPGAPGALAYADADIALGEGRYMLAPLVIARLAQLMMETDPAHMLVIGAGSGYGAAILQACGAQVVALEEDSRLPTAALTALAPGVEPASGKLALGWPAGGPYDAILIEGAVVEIPQLLAAQLAPHGRLVTIIGAGHGPSGLGHGVVAKPSLNGFAHVRRFDCAARILPALQPDPVFSF